jgi:hypothetical protein
MSPDAVVGAYTLQSVEGEALPFVEHQVPEQGFLALFVSGVLVIGRDGFCEERFEREWYRGGELETFSERWLGTWTLGAGELRLTFNEKRNGHMTEITYSATASSGGFLKLRRDDELWVFRK